MPDLAAANDISSTVSIALGNGDGSFQPKREFATGGSPYSVAVGDVNGDGRPDLVTANRDSNSVSILLGNGDGTFQPKTDFTTITWPYCVAVGDLNGDGHPDLVVVGAGSHGQVSVVLGNGDGTFRPGTDAATGIYSNALALGDLDHDGRLDIAVATYPRTVYVLLGAGDGHFGPSRGYDAVDIPQGLAIGDLDGDGTPDLAVVGGDAHHDSVSVLLGNGDGTFGRRTAFGTGEDPGSVAIGDLDGDGTSDVVVANRSSGTVTILPGTGGGHFGPGQDRYAYGLAPESVLISDFNLDGRLDLAMVNLGYLSGDPASNFAGSVWLGTSDGSFGQKPAFTGADPWAIATADLDHDGRLDLVVTNPRANTVSVMLGRGNGRFAPGIDFPTGPSPGSVAIGDLNGDGNPDLVVGVSILLGDGHGGFGPHHDFISSGGHVVLADVDHDGKLDIVTTSSVLRGRGDGTFEPKMDFATGYWSFSVAVGDLDGDGNPDLATTNPEGNVVSVLMGHGDGAFGFRTDIATRDKPHDVAIADLNGDGKPDLVVVLGGPGGVSMFPGNGDGTFGANADFATGSNPQYLAVGDLNGDGKTDVAVTNAWSSTVSVLLGNGDGGFEPRLDFVVGRQPRGVAIGDLDGDGHPDLAVLIPDDRIVSVLTNTGARVFTSAELALVDAIAEPDHVRLSWYCADVPGATVYRRTQVSPWSAVGTIVAQGTHMLAFEDRAVKAGERYGYRVGVERNGMEEFHGEAWVTVPAGFRLALTPPSPNPTRSPLSIAFTLASGGAARLEVVDISGRRVAVREVGTLGAGRQSLTFSDAAQWRPGIYLVRLTQSGQSLVTRACIIR